MLSSCIHIVKEAITGANAGPVHWRIYMTLGGDELINDSDEYAHLCSHNGGLILWGIEDSGNILIQQPGGVKKKSYQFFNLRALKTSPLYKNSYFSMYG